MKNLKIIKTLTLVLVAIMIVSSVSPKMVLAKNYKDSIDGYWVKGNRILYAETDGMTISISEKGERHSFCFGDYEPWDTNINKYSVRFHDKLDMDESGYFDIVVKKNKLKLKWQGGNYKYLKGTWKHKNWSYIPKSWSYNP